MGPHQGEYRNRFYVEEDHKLVSVLKFFDANSVSAQVTRILPRRGGSREIELYYEFVDFYQYSRLNFLEFSKPGSYAKLQELLRKLPGQAWSEEERQDFTTGYYCFHQAYDAQGGGRFDCGTLYYTPQIWCSDNTDAMDRLRIQYGTSFCYPCCTMGAHVAAVPNGLTHRSTPFHTRGVVAAAGMVSAARPFCQEPREGLPIFIGPHGGPGTLHCDVEGAD